MLNNIKETVKIHFIKFSFIYAPIIGLFIYFLLSKLLKTKLDTDFMSNLINVSGILSGFLFSSLGIIISLPSTKFTNFLKETGYMRIIYNSMIIGIMTLLISMLLGMFSISIAATKLLFIVGISETFLSAYYLYRVSYYSGKSN